MKDTHAVGNIGEAEVTRALIRAGYTVSHPFGEGAKYDLVLDKDGKLLRVQVKMGVFREGAIYINCYSVARSGGECSLRR